MTNRHLLVVLVVIVLGIFGLMIYENNQGSPAENISQAVESAADNMQDAANN